MEPQMIKLRKQSKGSRNSAAKITSHVAESSDENEGGALKVALFLFQPAA